MARILVVDDDVQVREMLCRMLKDSGHEAVEAPDGEIAVQLYRKNPADMIIMDLIMPVKEGIETIIELRRDFPEVKIIAISGGGRVGPDDYLSAAEQLGALRTFTKPFEREEFLAAVREILSP